MVHMIWFMPFLFMYAFLSRTLCMRCVVLCCVYHLELDWRIYKFTLLSLELQKSNNKYINKECLFHFMFTLYFLNIFTERYTIALISSYMVFLCHSGILQSEMLCQPIYGIWFLTNGIEEVELRSYITFYTEH